MIKSDSYELELAISDDFIKTNLKASNFYLYYFINEYLINYNSRD